MNAYRECIRNLWNVYFARKAKLAPGCFVDHFADVEKSLFESLVIDDLFYCGNADEADIPRPVLRVVPRSRAKLLIKASQLPNQSSYWGDGGEIFVTAQDIVLIYMGYFDFGNMEERDFRYYLCKISQFPSRAEFAGREALIEVTDSLVFHDEANDADADFVLRRANGVI
jgi:hypothetical protein